MICAVHSDKDAVGYCRNCGKAMCPDCVRDIRGMIYCEDCLVERVQNPAGAAPGAASLRPVPAATPYPAQGGPSPALALILGLIPGVGAIYNGQFAKAFLHVVVFGILVSIVHTHSVEPFGPLFGIGIAFFIFYMAGEAYHTARRRQMGQPVDEWSGLLSQSSRLQGTAGAFVLIALGAIFLLDTLNVIPLGQVLRYWPVILIIAGVLMLAQRIGGRPGTGTGDPSDFTISRPPEP